MSENVFTIENSIGMNKERKQFGVNKKKHSVHNIQFKERIIKKTLPETWETSSQSKFREVTGKHTRIWFDGKSNKGFKRKEKHIRNIAVCVKLRVHERRTIDKQRMTGVQNERNPTFANNTNNKNITHHKKERKTSIQKEDQQCATQCKFK